MEMVHVTGVPGGSQKGGLRTRWVCAEGKARAEPWVRNA